ncbi:hypothetical protein HNQ34_003017 [Anoxybacillus tepidamans]|uniref:RNA helicase n=1 Tax=Anoxybacteroides tepidamans TaxID=265948 RepID=A0A7W8ISM3_9BACL|nr:helicase-related protein [Anoxybacillus tepidamans]MBB5325911.1 hypothetical protein [Anoxybacillus tepidamans]
MKTEVTAEKIMQKLQEQVNRQFANLEEEMIRLIKEELSAIANNKNFTIKKFREVSDFWDDDDIYPFQGYYEFRFTLLSKCEDKIQEFVYRLLIDSVEELGIDEVRAYLVKQGSADEAEEMDIDDIGFELRHLLDHEIDDIVSDLLDDFGNYEISFLMSNQENSFQQLYKQTQKPDHLDFFNHYVENWLFEKKESIKKRLKEKNGEAILTDSFAVGTLFPLEEVKEKLVQTFFDTIDNERLLRILKYAETEISDDFKTRFQAIRTIQQTSIWKMYETIIDKELETWLDKAKKEVISLYDDWLKVCDLLSQSLSDGSSPNEIIMILDKLRNYLSFIKKADKKRRSEEEYDTILSKIECIYIEMLNKKYQCSIKWNPHKKKRWLKTWFTEIEEVEQSFLHSKGFNDHLKKLSKHIFENPLSLTNQYRNKKYIIHVGPTNSGKTYDSLQRLLQDKKGMYLAPLRLLALEKFEEMNHHGIKCALVTGEERKTIDGSTHISATVEAANLTDEFEVVVIDECQMLSDETRGSAWVKAIIGVKAKEIHLIVAPYAANFIQTLLNYHQFEFEVVEHERTTPLIWEEDPFHFPRDLKKGDALIVFSKRKVLNIAALLVKKGHKVSVLYGSMPPETRRKQVKQFRTGLTDVLVATDAIGMGLNLPIRRVIFMESEKFDGQTIRTLKAEEVQQIAGRAGRKGIYDEGFVNATKNRKKIKQLLQARVAPIEYSFLPISNESMKRFPYESFDLFKRAWGFYQKELKGTPYKVHDLSEQERKVAVLEKALHEMDMELSLWKKLSFCSIPFSIEESFLVDCWLTMVKEYLLDRKINMPLVFTSTDTIDELEKSYKKLMLYTSFAYSQSLSFDEDAVFLLKEEISEKIFEVLSKNLTSYMKKCSICGEVLPWDFPYPHCDHCHRCMYDDRYDYF